jgi:hypothetical protein
MPAARSNKLAPWLADRYLARSAVEGQQTGEPIPADRPDYRDAPLPGDRAAHGRFDDESRPSSLQLALTKRKRALLAAAALLTGALARARAR